MLPPIKYKVHPKMA